MGSASQEELLSFCRQAGVTERGLEIASEIIGNPPARRVKSNAMRGSISCRFPSIKMGQTIQCESRLEFFNCLTKEFDNKVLGFFDQPFHRPELSYTSKNRKVRHTVTLDFFVISEDFIGFEEVKPRSILEKLAQTTPGRCRFDEETEHYYFPPLESYLADTGLSHRIVCDTDFNPTYVNNLEFLNGYRLANEPEETRRILKLAAELIHQQGEMSVEALESLVPGLTRADLFSGIATGVLFTDLHGADVTDPEHLILSPVLTDSSVNMYDDGLELNDEHMRRVGNEQATIEMLRRIKTVEEYESSRNASDVAEHAGISVRTLRRWVSLFRSDGTKGLIPLNAKKGNREARLSARTEDLVQQVIDEKFLTNQNKSRIHVYQLLKSRCLSQGLTPPSRQAFYKRLEQFTDSSALMPREGKKSAYQFTAYRGVERQSNLARRPPKRFLQVCHVDHTQLDIELINSEGINLGRPWITLIIDEATGFNLSAYLSFKSPSAVSIMGALRLMVRTNGVFPEAFVVDGGKEFCGTYCETLFAKFDCNVTSRESAPRGGAPVERMNRTTNTVFLDNLDGNTKLTKFVRRLSGTHNPKRLAKWEALDFSRALKEFLNQWNLRSKKRLGLSPDQLRQNSIARYGIPQRSIATYDSEFLTDTLMPPKRPTLTLRRNKKIQVNRIDYWHPCLRSIPVGGKKVEVRYDPFNLNYVFVYYNNVWMKFTATKQPHRYTSDETEAAVISEIALRELQLNEGSKAEGRMLLAETVEVMNEEVVTASISRDRQPTPAHADSYLEEEQPQVVGTREKFRRLSWDMDISITDEEN